MHKRRKSSSAVPLIVAAFLSVFASGSMSLGAGASSHRARARPEISDAELRAFTQATLEIEEIQVLYQRAIVEAVQNLVVEASTKVRGTLANRNITVGEYGRILHAVQQSPSLRRKVDQIVRDEAEKRGTRQPRSPDASPGDGGDESS